METKVLLSILAVLYLGCGPDAGSARQRKPKVTETIADLGALPTHVTDPADNPSTPEKIHLGRLLFFDPVLSGNKDVSCATCHQPEFNYAEFLETSVGVNGVGAGSKRRFNDSNSIPFVKRNSQSILNTAFNGIANQKTYKPESAPMFWNLRYTAPYMHSGKFATLDQVLMFYEDVAGGKIANPNVNASQMDSLATHMDVNFKDISRIVEFLNTLNDDSFDKTVPASVPSGLPVSGL